MVKESDENIRTNNKLNRAIAMKLGKFIPLKKKFKLFNFEFEFFKNIYLKWIILGIVIIIVCIILIYKHILTSNLLPIIGIILSLCSIVYLIFLNRKNIIKLVNYRKQVVNAMREDLIHSGDNDDIVMLLDIMSSGHAAEYKESRIEDYKKLTGNNDLIKEGSSDNYNTKHGGFKLSDYFDKDKKINEKIGYYGYDDKKETEDPTGQTTKLAAEFQASSGYGEFEAASGYGEF